MPVRMPRPRMLVERPLAQIAASLSVPPPAEATVVVTGVTHDSREIRAGDLYAALPGQHHHGAEFLVDAARAGAVAVLTDEAGARLAASSAADLGITVLTVDEPRAALGQVAAEIYGDPSHKLRLFGVTGTNGKTTVTYLLDAGLRAAGHRTGMLSTVETRLGDERFPSVRTTPEVCDLQALLAVMGEKGVSAASMEVSSHALALHRVDAVDFAGAAFTNLSQDHLDFHRDMEEYFAAKALLFTDRNPRTSVIGVDTDWGRRLAAMVPHARTVGAAGGADWWAEDVRTESSGSCFVARGPAGLAVPVHIALPGAFNVSNALCALAMLIEAGIPAQDAATGIGTLTGVPGRMERIDEGQRFLVLVDYAHTPDAVATVLATVRPLVSGRVTVVVGCGGDRDRRKRPLMAAAAVRGADRVIFTSDNPRSEDPEAILGEMIAGVDRSGFGSAVETDPDRRRAIRRAIASAGDGDAVVVAGKGHEGGQEINGVVTPFDDREVVRDALTELRQRVR